MAWGSKRPPTGVSARDELLRAVAAGRFKPVILMYGEEQLLISRDEDAIRRKLLGDRISDFNNELFYCEDGSGRALAESASMPAFGGGPKLVVGRSAQELDDDDLGALAAYAGKPLESNVLVLVFGEGSPWGPGKPAGGAAEFKNALKKSGMIVHYALLDRKALAAHLRNAAAGLGMKVSEDALDLLIEETGDELAFLEGALGQAALLAGSGAIKMEDMSSIIIRLRGFSIFELTAVLGEQKLPKALAMVEGIMRAPKELPRHVAMIARHFRILIKVRDMMNRGCGLAEISRETGVADYFLKNEYCVQARNFPAARLKSALQCISEMDLDIRTGRLADSRAVERLFVRLCA